MKAVILLPPVALPAFADLTAAATKQRMCPECQSQSNQCSRCVYCCTGNKVPSNPKFPHITHILRSLH